MQTFLEGLDTKKVDVKATFVEPIDGRGQVSSPTVKLEDFVFSPEGITLKAHNSGTLLGKFIPMNQVLAIQVYKREDVPGFL